MNIFLLGYVYANDNYPDLNKDNTFDLGVWLDWIVETEGGVKRIIGTVCVLFIFYLVFIVCYMFINKKYYLIHCYKVIVILLVKCKLN